MHYILSLLTSNEIVDVVKALGDEIVCRGNKKRHNLAIKIVP